MISKIQTNNSNYPNFKGTYIVQIPHKAFANSENIKECSKLVGDQMSKLMRPNKFLQKCNKLLNMFNSKLFCYPERFSYMFSKTGMDVNNMNNSIKWLRENTGLPIADVLRENFHSFFIYTNKEAHNVLKEITSACKNTRVPEFCEKYTDPKMIAIAMNAKIGVALDKGLEKQYNNAITYEIKNLSELGEIAQKIRKADKK